jgi:hypothetical protein
MTAVLVISGLTFQVPNASAEDMAKGGKPFLYRGKFDDTNRIANGSYKLTFYLFDSASAGKPVAGPVTNTSVTVINGHFATTLDFGAGPFTAANYWMEFSASAMNSNAPVDAGSRRELKPSPWASHKQGYKTSKLVGMDQETK